MPYKNILVHFDDTPASAKRLEAAAALAGAHGAHLTGLVLEVESMLPTYVDARIPAQIMEQLRTTAEEETRRTVARFREIIGRRSDQIDCRVAQCNVTEIGRTLALHARYADLLVLGQPFPTDEGIVGRRVLENVLLSSGRPVLVVPYIGAGVTIGERVMVGWDAGREAARAVSDAMPLLERAKSVTVMTVNPQAVWGAHGDVPGADIALHLARHGIDVEAASIATEDLQAGDAIVSAIADRDIDLLVMGAYGHTRVRELVLGGATRSILDQMTVPVLMSH